MCPHIRSYGLCFKGFGGYVDTEGSNLRRRTGIHVFRSEECPFGDHPRTYHQSSSNDP